MLHTILRSIIILFALINFGFMTFDGARALIVGDYIRPDKGEYAGQLGLWSGLAENAGIDPESNLMKSILVIFGVIGIALTTGFAFNAKWVGRL